MIVVASLWLTHQVIWLLGAAEMIKHTTNIRIAFYLSAAP